MLRSDSAAGHFEINLDDLHLADGSYEYEFFVVDSSGPSGRRVADPYAEELTRFGGYRGVFQIAGGRRDRPAFSWDDELSPGVLLPNNNVLVIYEMPLRWMSGVPDDDDYRQVDLGTFDSALFEHLDDLATLGINAIEFLPIQDSPDTLNWGYGTRFFFAPDIDMGSPVDLKFFIKLCHRRGIRVILDMVMNHSAAVHHPGPVAARHHPGGQRHLPRAPARRSGARARRPAPPTPRSSAPGTRT